MRRGCANGTTNEEAKKGVCAVCTRSQVTGRRCPRHKGVVDIRSCRDFRSFELHPGSAARFSSFAPPRRRGGADELFAERPEEATLAALGPPPERGPVAEACRAPSLAALLGLMSEDLFVEGPPGARERAGRPSPDLVRICCRQHFSSSAPENAANFSRTTPGPREHAREIREIQEKRLLDLRE